jgi:Holliday junction resolvasome RuvABC endonuclease subunit
MENLQTILSIDLGMHTGWAIRHSNGRITSGTAHLHTRQAAKQGEGWGRRFLRFSLWLDELLKSTRHIDAVYFEKVHQHCHLGTAAAHSYGGFLSHLTHWCEHYRIPYVGVPVKTIKRFITGKGNAGKYEVVEAIIALGHKPVDDNEADALALLYFAMKEHEVRTKQALFKAQGNQILADV